VLTLDHEALKIEKYWNELLQVLTSDDNFKLRKTEIDSLWQTETIEFFQHLNFFDGNIEERIKRIQNAKS
jgi:hypothetical protein